MTVDSAKQIFARAGVEYVGPDDAPWSSGVRDAARKSERSSRSGPAPTPDVVGPPYFGSHQPPVTIDRFAVNPGVEYVRATVPSNHRAGAAPSMFSCGDWPLFTASGLDVDVLRWVPWKVRHAAALSTDRQFVAYCVEEGNGDLFDPDDLQTPAGADALGLYFARVRQWALTPEPTSLGEAEYEATFGPGRA